MKKALSKNKKIVAAISGGFDPIHIGHVRMIAEARALGDELVVIINNDNWLRMKKGYVFMPQEQRKEIIENIKGVDRVIITNHKKGTTDMSVCEALKKLKPGIFVNGGDRMTTNTPEVALCKKLGIKMVWNVGNGGKVQSSSWLVSAVRLRDRAEASRRRTARQVKLKSY